jgi:hypothetical protein
VAAVAEAAGLPLNVNGSHETGVGNAGNLHLVASTAAVTEAGVFPVTTVEGKEPTTMAGKMYLDDIVTEPFVYRDGNLIVPSKPGLGIDLDEGPIAAAGDPRLSTVIRVGSAASRSPSPSPTSRPVATSSLFWATGAALRRRHRGSA